MPFDEELYDGIFCYAMLHLLTKPQRRKFLQSCYDQLKPGGIMVFSVVSREAAMYGKGKLVSKDRFEVMKGVTVYFYDEDSIKKEFSDFGLVSFEDINEPIKHMTGQEPLKLKFVVCKKP
jgi:SAM-dependent methyltransferase